MSAETTYLAKIAADIQYLKALMARSVAAASANEPTTDPVIDFCCDMFDRGDQPVLDGYWGDDYQQWALRSRVLIPQASPASLAGAPKTSFQQLQTQLHAVNSVSGSVDGQALPNVTTSTIIVELGNVIGFESPGTVFTTYRGQMRASDMTIKITFTIPEAANTTVDVSNSSNPLDKTTERNTATGNYGAFFADEAAHKFGTHLTMFGALPAQTSPHSITASGGAPVSDGGSGSFLSPASSLTIPAITQNVFTTGGAAGYIGNYQTLAKPVFKSIVGSFVTDTLFSQTAGNMPTDLGIVEPYTSKIVLSNNHRVPVTEHVSRLSGLSVPLNLTSENVLLVVAASDTYTFTLNGVVFAGDTGNYITRKRVGLSQAASATLTSIIAGQVPYAGITSFKAWRSDMPEPPNQTGRGTFEGGSFVYNDRYHTANAAGQVVYNPLA